ncbi:hypothetical protein D3C81_1134770 [compost metagenome]
MLFGVATDALARHQVLAIGELEIHDASGAMTDGRDHPSIALVHLHGDVLQDRVLRHAIHGIAATDVVHSTVSAGVDLRGREGVAQPAHDGIVLQAHLHIVADIGVEDRQVTAKGGHEVHGIARCPEDIPRMHDFAEADAGRDRRVAVDLAAGKDEQDAFLAAAWGLRGIGLCGELHRANPLCGRGSQCTVDTDVPGDLLCRVGAGNTAHPDR